MSTRAQDVVKFDPAAAAERMRERVRAMLGEMLTDDELTRMIHRELDSFSKKPTGASEKYVTPLGQLVHSEMGKILAPKINAALQEYMTQEWDNVGNPMIPEAVKKLIVEAAPAILTAMLNNGIAQVLQQLPNNIRF